MPSSGPNVAMSYTVPQDPELSGGEPCRYSGRAFSKSAASSMITGIRRTLWRFNGTPSCGSGKVNTITQLAAIPDLCLGDADVLRQTPLILVELQLKR